MFGVTLEIEYGLHAGTRHKCFVDDGGRRLDRLPRSRNVRITKGVSVLLRRMRRSSRLAAESR